MKKIIKILLDFPFSSFFYSVSALDLYFSVKEVPVVWVAFDGTIADLARYFSDLSFPGRPFVDAVLESDGIIFTFKEIESLKDLPVGPVSVMNFFYSVKGAKFLDPFDIYSDLKGLELKFPNGVMTPLSKGSFSGNRVEETMRYWKEISDTALLLARYGYALPENYSRYYGAEEVMANFSGLLPAQLQKEILLLVLTGDFPSRGLSFLMKTGFIKHHWPELSLLDSVDHSKEYHPEGNVWEHTLETFSHRKDRNIVVSLALLLHDLGKPLARENAGRRFDKHAQLGGREAWGFLKRLGFSGEIIEDVRFLVENHMLPAFISKLPPASVSRALSSPLFPSLLEVYRCDLSSTFRGPSGYYDACKAYRRYLKNVRNPFRNEDGKKKMKIYVAG